ncbi:MAG: FtsX-like permease family protein [Phycisphaeraceae bacterium]
MTLTRLMFLSLRRFWRTNLGVMLGVALASTVITGALLVGDSMRYTLSQAAEQRLGGIDQAVIGGDRFFTTELASTLGQGSSGIIVAQGVVSTPDGTRRANNVALIGVDDEFVEMMGLPTHPDPEQAVLNKPLYEQLGLSVDDTLIIRVPKPSALPIDASLVNASKPALALRVNVTGIANDNEGGRFSLRAEQRTPMNIFVNRDWLAEQLEQAGRVNLALSPQSIEPFSVSLSDIELSLAERSDGQRELNTPRVFIDASIETDLAELSGQRLLTYMVNTVSLGDAQSPYAMVTAADSLGGLDLADDEIAINTWLADDIGAAVGDSVTLTYFLPDEGDRLLEATATLTVKRIVPIHGVFADRTLTPDFPGLAEAAQLSRWDAGPAIDRSRIRDKDEAYWDDYRATPKAFINLATGQRLWSNRFGTLTAIRFDADTTEAQILDRIDTDALGLVATDIKAQAKAAAVGTVDFGQLFLSLSGFIIISAVVLAALLFAMSAEQRARQLGTMLALGLNQRQASALLLGEGCIVASLGALVGIGGAVLYASSVTQALAGVWSGAVAGSAVLLHMTPMSLILGPLATLLISLLAMGLSVRSLTRRSARELLAGGIGKVSSPSRLPKWLWLIVGVLCLFAAVIFALTNSQSGMRAAMIGFTGGAACLTGCLILLYALLMTRKTKQTGGRLLQWHRSLAILNLTRRRGRTLAGVFMLGSGLFLVFAVSGFHLGTSDDPTLRASGTGGFTLLVETSQPIRYDLNTELGRDHYALSEDELPSGSVVPIRVSSGDDASCLNLNQTPTPRVLGVDPALLSSREAFAFFSLAGQPPTWDALTPEANETGAIPVIADASTAQWALKLAIGDTLIVPDEQGQPVTLQLVGTIENSILQGSLILHEQAFEKIFPSMSGYRMMLVDDIPSHQAKQTASLLNEVLVDEGAMVTSTTDRLAEYNRVQNTYLAVFQLLGGLGVLLGALGLGIVTARNLLERRSELALLSAVGLSRGRIARIVLTEHATILVLGLLVGSGSASLATYHATSQASSTTVGDLLIFAAPLLAGLIAIILGLLPVIRGRLTDALRKD